ncbi:hypothetical protein [Terrarubrum flagellatum]|uniref:hypothetical protein n=1 Tax=Terrirubrum flagellatum TaxID=2895980 RepID=UPI003144EC78
MIEKRDHFSFFVLGGDLYRALTKIAGHPHVRTLIVSAKAQLDRFHYLSLEQQAGCA